jgi:DNA-binding transcriptional LysR family regulator
MRREEMADLTPSVVVAEERTFTRAAGKLGLSQSALSQIVRRLEARLVVHLRARTTRSVAPTQAGERLVKTLTPMLHADALRHRSPEPKPRSKYRRRSA